MEPVAEQLQREPARVINCDVVADDREGQNDQAELGPPSWVVDFSDEAAKTMVGVGVAVWAICRAHSGVTDAGTDDRGESGWNQHTKEGQEEDFGGLCFRRVIAVVVWFR